MSNSKCVYYKEKEQKSIDGGITWVDTGNFRKGALISTQASQCGSFTNEYRWIKADYVCDNGNKYNGYKQQVSYDNGGNWSDTGVVNIGDLIESNSRDCTGDTGTTTGGTTGNTGTTTGETTGSTTGNTGTTTGSTTGGTTGGTTGDTGTTTGETTGSMKVTYLDGTEKTFTGLTSIEKDTDANKKNAKEVIIYDGVTSIGNMAFYDCEYLTSVTIPDSCNTIGNFAFDSCFSLTSIIIPANVRLIGGYAFNRCASLRTITVQATTPPYLESYAISGDVSIIYVPAASVNSYKSARGWKYYNIQAIPQ